MLAPPDGRIARDRRPAAAALVVVEEGAAAREPVVLRKQVVVVGAESRAGGRVLGALLDSLQSIPVLGFLPGLVLGLMSLFPTRNVGLELAAILMIFTAQAWNLALSFYSSLKGLPAPLRDACKVAGWKASRTFWQLEVPGAAQGLVWNGMLSMAGGWVLLMVNEAVPPGGHDHRPPGNRSRKHLARPPPNRPAPCV